MSVSTSHNGPATAAGPDPARNNLRNIEKVRAIFSALAKYINAKTIYASNNPTVAHFAEAFREAFRSYFEDEKELLLAVEQYQLKWRDEVVYRNTEKVDSLAFLLYKDGIGEVTIHSSVKQEELDQLADLIKNEIYNPSAHLDIVGRLWQLQFTNIFYRVFDDSADGATGDGKGSGAESREGALHAGDHPEAPGGADDEPPGARSDGTLEPLYDYLLDIIEHTHPQAAPHQEEEQIENLLESFFTAGTEELKLWYNEYSAIMGRDRLFWLFNVMLDFTQEHHTPAVVRDINDIIERLVRYLIEEAHIPTLIALLDIQRHMAHSRAIAPDFQSIPDRLKEALTNSAFLLALGKTPRRSNGSIHEVLRYFRMVGGDAVPGVCELLAAMKDSSMHTEACDALLDIAGNGVLSIVNNLNLDNPYEARDAVYLLQRCVTNEVPPIIRRLMASPDLQVRESVIEYLPRVGNEEAAMLLAGLLDDNDSNIRIKTLSAVEEFRNPLIIDKVHALCFSEDGTARSADELERMFRTVGKLAGADAVPQIKRMIRKKGWLPLGRKGDKQHKLLAITALRHIPGTEALNALLELSNDRDPLVKTKALYMLRQMEEGGGDRSRESELIGSEGTV